MRNFSQLISALFHPIFILLYAYLIYFKIDCFNNPYNDYSAYLAWEKNCVNARKNIALLIEKEAYRLGYGKRGKTKLSNDEKYIVVENVKKKLRMKRNF